jgi:hypothetical protein
LGLTVATARYRQTLLHANSSTCKPFLLFYFFTTDFRMINSASWLCVALLGLALLLGVTKATRPGGAQQIAAGAIACLSLLTMYHLIADSPILVLLVPALCEIWARRRRLALAIGACAISVLSRNDISVASLRSAEAES